MDNTQGLKNFIQNIKPTMMKLKEGKKKLTAAENKSIVEFYLEVVHCVYLDERER